MSSVESTAERAQTKSPLKLAIGLSLVITAGTVLSTLDASIFQGLFSGKWLTGPLAETQQRQTAAITSLEQTVGAITKDIDFVAARIGTSVRRSEDQTYDRFARLDAEIAVLKEKFAGIQSVRISPPRASDALLGNSTEANGDVTGLRSSLHDLAAAHNGAVAAITKRLDRIEVMVGLATDMTSSVADPLERRKARRSIATVKLASKQNAAPVPPKAENAAPAQTVARPERGHIFNVKPVSQQIAPLRLSKLPG